MQKPVERDIIVDNQLLHYYRVQASSKKKDIVIFFMDGGRIARYGSLRP